MLKSITSARTKAMAVFAVFSVLLTTLTLVAPGWGTAEAQVDVGPAPDASACYGVADQAFGGDDGLSVINRFSGATANIGATGTGTSDIEAVAFGPGTIIDPMLAQQVLYTFEGVDFGFVNLTTGLFTSLGLAAPDGFETVDGMTWDPQMNVFWLTDRIGGDGIADRVAAYDPFTGNTTVGPFPTGIATEPGWTTSGGLAYDDFDDIALDPTNFRLYAILNKGGTGGGLVELDKTDGTVIDYIGLFAPVDAASDFDGDSITDDMEGLAFFNDGSLYGSTGANGPGLDNNRFFSIDLATGTTTWISDFTGYADYEALGCLTVEAFIDVEKGTSEPGATPEDADQGPGPTITTPTVEWTYVITNESLSLGLQNVVLVDDQIAGVLFNQATGETQCVEGAILAPGEVLAPLASVTCTVVGTTIDGPYTNTATLTGQADPGDGLDFLDLVDIDPSNYVGDPILPDPPVLAVVKTAVAGAGVDCDAVTPVTGDGPVVTVPTDGIVTFCVTVTNTGGSDATNVTVTDNNATPGDAADDFVVTGLDGIDLAMGASATGSFEVAVTSLTPILNTVSATGIDPNTGEPTNEPTDTAQVVALGAPALAVIKTVVAGDVDCAAVTPAPGDDAITVEIGDTVTFCVTVTNTGSTQATNVTVTDNNLTPADPADDFVVTGLDDITLEAGESATGSITYTVASQAELVNTVTATGIDPNTGEPTNEPTDPAGILPPQGNAELAVVKTAVVGADVDCSAVTPAPGDDVQEIELGDSVTFCVTVTNVGDGPATNVVVIDDNFTPADTADDFAVTGLDGIDLAAGESATGAIVVVASDLEAKTNVVAVTGTDPNSGEPTNEPTDPAGIVPFGTPILTIVKTAFNGADVDCATVTPASGLDEVATQIGDTVTYCIIVTNIGNGPATNVVVTDDNFTPADTADDVVVAEASTLAPGATVVGSFTKTVTDAAGLQNTAVVTGIDPITGNPTNEPTDPAGSITPAIDLVKQVLRGHDRAASEATEGVDELVVGETGDEITWVYTVSNAGSMPLIVTEIVDPTLGITVPVPVDQQLIAPGESVSVTFNDVITRTGGTSEAFVIGQPADSAGQPAVGFPELTAANDAAERPVVGVGGVVPGPPQLEIVSITNPPATRTPPSLANPPSVTTPPPAPPLALTGSNSTALIALANMAFLIGGVFIVTARRRREDEA